MEQVIGAGSRYFWQRLDGSRGLSSARFSLGLVPFCGLSFSHISEAMSMYLGVRENALQGVVILKQLLKNAGSILEKPFCSVDINVVENYFSCI